MIGSGSINTLTRIKRLLKMISNLVRNYWRYDKFSTVILSMEGFTITIIIIIKSCVERKKHFSAQNIQALHLFSLKVDNTSEVDCVLLTIDMFYWNIKFK